MNHPFIDIDISWFLSSSKNLRIFWRATLSSSHAFLNFTFDFSALVLLFFCPFSLRHKSMVCRTSIPTALRDPAGVRPFLYMGLRPSPLLGTVQKLHEDFLWRVQQRLAGLLEVGKKTLRKRVNTKMSCKSEKILTREYRSQEIQ